MTKAQREARRKLKPSARAILEFLSWARGKTKPTTHDLMGITYIDSRNKVRTGCLRFSARILELRKAGYRIETERRDESSSFYSLRTR